MREFARRGQNVTDSRCIQCGACIEKCPRGTLRWGPAILVREDNTIFSDEPYRMYSRPGIAYFLLAQVTETQIMARSDDIGAL